MSRNMKLFLIVLVLSIFILVSFGVVSAEQKDKKEGLPAYMKMASSAPGGSWYPIAAQMCVIIERETGVLTTLQPGSSVENMKVVHFGDADTGWAPSNIAYMAYNGIGTYAEDDIKYDNIRHWLTVCPQGIHFVVRADSDITSIRDLKGKRFGFLRVGSGTNVTANNVFEIYGLNLNDFRSVSYLGYTDGPKLLADKNIDVFVTQGAHPYAPLAEIDFNPGFRLLQIDEELLDKYFELDPSSILVTITKGAYNNMEKDIVTVGNYGIVTVNKNLSDEFVYAMTKALYENTELMWEVGTTTRNWFRLETATQGAGMPVHPGALKYYEEHGVSN